MKRLNIKLLVVLAVLFVGGGIGTVLLHGYQMKKTASTRLDNANSAADNGDIVREYKQLSRYLQHKPDDKEMYKRYLVVFKKAIFTGKVTENLSLELSYLKNGLEKAIRNNPNDVELRQESIEFWLTLGEQAEAADHLEHLQSLNQEEKPYWGELRPEDARRLAGIRILMSQDREALEILGKSLDFDTNTTQFGDEENPFGKNDLLTYQVLAEYYRKKMSTSDTYEIPNRIMEKMVERNGEDAKAYVMMAGYKKRISKGAEDAGLAEIDKALELDGEDADVINTAASFYAEARRNAKARELMDRGLNLFPDDPRFYRSRARLYLTAENNPEAAIELLNKALNDNENLKLNDQLLHDRVLAELDAKKTADAKSTFALLNPKTIKRLRPEQLQVLDARIDIAEQNYLDAAKTLERVRQKITNTSSAYQQQITRLLAEAYERGGQRHKVAQLMQGDGMKSDNEQATQLTRAQELVQRGDFEEALSLYADVEKAVTRFQPGGAARADFLKEILSVNFQKQKALPEAKRSWQTVDNLAQAYMSAKNMSAEDRALFAIQVLSEKGDRREARRLAENGRIQRPNNPNFWVLEIGLTRDNEQALRIIDLMEKAVGETVYSRSAKGERIAKINAPDAIQQLEALLVGIDQFSPNEQAEFKRFVANQLAEVGGSDAAIKILEEELAQGGNAIPLITNIFNIAIKSGNEPKMDLMLNKFRDITGAESPEYLVHGARKTLWQIQNGANVSKLQSVYTDLDTAAARQQGWHLVSAVRSDALLIENKTAAAIDAMEQAYEESPQNSYAQSLAKLYMRVGDLASSRKYLNKLPDGAKSVADVRNEILIQSRDRNPDERRKALERAKSIVNSDTKSADELMFLAQVFDSVGNKKSATAAYKRATEVSPNTPNAWLQYVTNLRITRDFAAGEDAIKKIQLTSIDPTDMALLLGQCNALMNHIDEAKRHYREASNLTPDSSIVMRNIVQLTSQDGDAPMRDEYLDKLLALDPKTREDERNIQWARQMKASLLAGSKTYPDFQKAVSLIEQNRNSFGKLGAQDLIVWLRLHANRTEPDSRRKATAKLAEIQRQRPLNPTERSIQAALFKAAGQWTEARSAMLALIADQPDNPTIITPYVEWLIERGDRDSLIEAGQMLNRLPNGHPEKLRLSSIVLVKRGQSKEAYTRLMALVPRNLPKQNSKTIREVARMMSVLGEFDANFYKSSRVQWERYLKTLNEDQHAAEFPLYVASLMSVPNDDSNQRLKSAFAQCNKAAKSDIKKQEWARVLTYVTLATDGIRNNISNIAPDSPFFKATQSWLDAVHEAEFSPEDSLIQQAFLSDLRQDHDRVEQAYRAFLALPNAKAFNKGVVRNNLAYHLATTGKGQEALEVVNEAITALGTRNDLRDTRAMAYIDLKRYADAISDLNAIESDGEASPSTYFHRAIAKMKDSDRDGATLDINRAIELGLKKSELREYEAKLYDELVSTLGISAADNALSASS